MTRKHEIIVGLLIVLAICLAFLIWPDRQHDTHASQHADVVAEHDTLKAHGVIYGHSDDSLIKENMRLKDANKSLLKGQAITESKLNAKSSEVKTLVAQIREINQDTGYFRHLLDSLQEQYDNLQYLIVQYEQYADSINNVNDSLKIGHDAVKREDNKRIAELKTAYDKLYKNYNELFDTTRGLMKDLKRQKLKTKVAAVLGAAGSVILFLK